MTSLKENIQNNRAKILFYLGVFIVSLFRIFATTIQDTLPEDTWYSKGVVDALNISMIFLTIIAPFIFGTDAKLDDVKQDRTTVGKANYGLMIMNEGYRVTNNLLSSILEQNKITAYKYEVPKAAQDLVTPPIKPEPVVENEPIDEAK